MSAVKPKIAVIYWSLYGHIATLAEAIAEGAKSAGADVSVFTIPETFSSDVLAKMHAAPRKEDVTEFHANDLVNYDGILFGIPTRYGRAPAQVSAFFDRTGGLWAKGALNGKFAGIFSSTAGGQETTALTTIPFFVHHGMIYVPIVRLLTALLILIEDLAGYGANELNDLQEIVGGSPYGAAAIAGGDGSRKLTEKELSIGKFQGQDFAKKVGVYVRGQQA